MSILNKLIHRLTESVNTVAYYLRCSFGGVTNRLKKLGEIISEVCRQVSIRISRDIWRAVVGCL
jgi:hypothetical protein